MRSAVTDAARRTTAITLSPSGAGRPKTKGAPQFPFAKAYSGLSDEEMRKVDTLIRKTTVESFGPVRRPRPTLLFELGFEGIALSKRHKSGVATRGRGTVSLPPQVWRELCSHW
jgi:ATP-dependent DNA ligase